MDPLEKLVKRGCAAAIAALAVYIAVLLLPDIPQQAGNQIRKNAGQLAQYAIGETSLIASYLCAPQKASGGESGFVQNLFNAPLGLYSYCLQESEENDALSEASSEVTPSEIEGVTPSEPEEVTPSESEEGMPSDSDGVPLESNEASSAVLPASMLIPSGTSVISKMVALSQTGSISLDQMLSYEYLMEHLYRMNPGCSMTQEILNPQLLLSKDLSVSKTADGPQILIYHTHSQEAYIDSVPGDVSQTIVGVGEYLTSLLTDQYGYCVLHDTGVYDMDNGALDRGPAYDRALPVLTQLLEQYPTIQVVIDLHRDGVAEGVHLVTEVNGKPTAKMMLFNGVCRDTEGDLPDLVNPYREDNLAFSLQMGLSMKTAYPDVLRMIYFKKSRYNQHLASRSILVEVGAQTNTVEEAMNAMEILAQILDNVLS